MALDEMECIRCACQIIAGYSSPSTVPLFEYYGLYKYSCDKLDK